MHCAISETKIISQNSIKGLIKNIEKYVDEVYRFKLLCRVIDINILMLLSIARNSLQAIARRDENKIIYTLDNKSET